MTPEPNENVRSVERQLFSNQLWETVAFLAKAGFMLGLTPLMIRTWGSTGYGEFALANSVFVLLSLTDLGIRARTRLALCRVAEHGNPERSRIFVQGLVTFAMIGGVVVCASFLLSASGVEHWLFRISAGDRYLIFVTSVLSIGVMFSGLLLEPLVVAGRIGCLKRATALGWLVAIPALALVLWNHGSILFAIVFWLSCLLGANVLTYLGHLSFYQGLASSRSDFCFVGFFAVVRESFWFNACNASWAAKTYGTTLLLSALYGPAVAGFFFILLRLSEVISMLGAISCDVLLGELAQARSIAEQQLSFKATYRYAVVLSTHLGILVGFSTNDIYRLWWPAAGPLPFYAGAVVAALGITSAINRKAVYTAMGLGAVKLAARCGLWEAFAFLAVVGLLPPSLAVIDRLALACLAVAALFPIIVRVSRELSTDFVTLWLHPFVSVLPFAGASALIVAFASATGSVSIKLAALGLAGFLLLLNIGYLYKTMDTTRGARLAATPPAGSLTLLARSLFASGIES